MQIDGIVTIVQESRFQLIDGAGVGHLVSLGAGSGAEPDQLEALAARRARVRVRCKTAPGTIGWLATAIAVL